MEEPTISQSRHRTDKLVILHPTTGTMNVHSTNHS